MIDLKLTDNTWTLFLDRDGVINHEKKDDYIRNKTEFNFYGQVKDAMKLLSERFGFIVMVTNQRGIGKGLMSEKDLSDIHDFMITEIVEAGGRVDRIYHATALDNNSFERKPNPGMAYRAKKDFPSIDLTKSIMVGNKMSDMEFGRNAGMFTVFVATTHPETPFPHPAIDLRFDSLFDFAKYLA